MHLKHIIVVLCTVILSSSSTVYKSTFTGRVATTSLVFYEDNAAVHAMVTFKDKKGNYVSLNGAGASLTLFYYCTEISSFTNRPDTNAYREEKDITIKPRDFEEITLSDGAQIFGLPIFRYDGVPWFTYDQNWYKVSPEIFFDKERICKKVSLHFSCSLSICFKIGPHPKSDDIRTL